MTDHIKYHYDVIQGTDEWLRLKMGVLSASNVKNIITAKTLKPSKDQKSKTQFDDVLSQRIDPTLQYGYMSDEMMRGHDDEPYAIEAYEQKYGLKVTHCGFITNNSFGGMVGYSPDGLVGDDGLIEVKSRSPKFQTKTILDHIVGRIDELIPSEYMIQCQTGLLFSERTWLDFISFCNGHHMVTIEVLPDEKYQDPIRDAVIEFEATLKQNMQDYWEVVEKDLRLTKTERREIEEMII